MTSVTRSTSLLLQHSSKPVVQSFHKHSCNVTYAKLSVGLQWQSSLPHSSIDAQNRKILKYSQREHNENRSGRAYAMSIDLDSESSQILDGKSLENLSSPTPGTSELKALLADSERQKLLKKLSEANQHNRFLKRQMQSEEQNFVNFQNELAVSEVELEALVGLAEEVANTSILIGSRKINGKYIQFHLLSRLKVVHERIKGQIKDVNAIKLQDIQLSWYGMAESVQVMGSFDGWSQGETMSAEYAGTFTKFSTTIKLRPGRYEIKFLVDGEWRLSPELPSTGEGLTQNNLLVVK